MLKIKIYLEDTKNPISPPYGHLYIAIESNIIGYSKSV